VTLSKHFKGKTKVKAGSRATYCEEGEGKQERLQRNSGLGGERGEG